MASSDQSARPSRVRHYVIAARDLDAVCDELYDFLGVEPTPESVEGGSVTEQYGFRTRMIRVGTTMLEVVSPIRERHELQMFFVEQDGDGGFMVVMQTYDDEALLARAAAHGLDLAFEIPDFLGQHLMQFDYKVFGCRFELYLYTPEDNWWGDPLNGSYHDPTVASDIVGAEVAVEDPETVADLAARTFLGTRDGTAVHFLDRRIEFVASGGGRRGLRALDLVARDRARVGESRQIANVELRLA
jgi:hypothetical protein